jgi:broad specificity phosphatase PhoE
LNEEGARQAIQVRDAFLRLGIPLIEVLASPSCRAWQSADLSFGRHTRVDGLNLPPSKDYSEVDKKAMRDTLLPLLAKAVPTGTSTVIMAHDDNMPAAGGPEIKTQGEAVIVKTDGRSGFTVVAHISGHVSGATPVADMARS